MNIEAWSAFCGRIEANLRTPHNVTATPSPAESLPPPPPPRNVTPNISQNQKRIQCLADAFVCVSKLVVAQAAQIRVRFRIQFRIRFLLAVYLAEMCGNNIGSNIGSEIGSRNRIQVSRKLDAWGVQVLRHQNWMCSFWHLLDARKCIAQCAFAGELREQESPPSSSPPPWIVSRSVGFAGELREKQIAVVVAAVAAAVISVATCAFYRGGIEGETHRVAVVVAAVAVSSPLFVPRFVPTWFVAVRCAAVVVCLPRCLFFCVSLRCGLWRRHVVSVAFPCQSGVSFRHGLLGGGVVWGSSLVTLVVALLIVVWFVLMS